MAIYIYNTYITPDKKQFLKTQISEIFFKSTRVYFILQRFIRRFKHRKLKIHDMNMDLCMNPLEEFKDKHKLTLVENKTIYNFRLTDLLNIICYC